MRITKNSYPMHTENCRWIQRVHTALQFQCTDMFGLAFPAFLSSQTVGMSIYYRWAFYCNALKILQRFPWTIAWTETKGIVLSVQLNRPSKCIWWDIKWMSEQHASFLQRYLTNKCVKRLFFGHTHTHTCTHTHTHTTKHITFCAYTQRVTMVVGHLYDTLRIVYS